MALTFRPLTKSLGAEVCGVDLRNELTPQVVSEITRAWERHGVLLFRDQALSLDDQRRFSQYFGDLQLTRNGDNAGSNFMYIGNVTIDGIEGEVPSGELVFHQDGAYAERPAKQTTLFGLEIPSAGGNTKFCSTARAYAALPPELRKALLAYDIRFELDKCVRTFSPSTLLWSVETRGAGNGPHYTHPLVIAHPATGEPLLFCNALHGDSIVGLERNESDALLNQLLVEMERPEEVYEHVWRVGDLIAWDNLLTQHARTEWDPSERRALRRTQTVGSKPIPYREVMGQRVAAGSAS
jgi:taurine dioxygenase